MVPWPGWLGSLWYDTMTLTTGHGYTFNGAVNQDGWQALIFDIWHSSHSEKVWIWHTDWYRYVQVVKVTSSPLPSSSSVHCSVIAISVGLILSSVLITSVPRLTRLAYRLLRSTAQTHAGVAVSLWLIDFWLHFWDSTFLVIPDCVSVLDNLSSVWYWSFS